MFSYLALLPSSAFRVLLSFISVFAHGPAPCIPHTLAVIVFTELVVMRFFTPSLYSLTFLRYLGVQVQPLALSLHITLFDLVLFRLISLQDANILSLPDHFRLMLHTAA